MKKKNFSFQRLFSNNRFSVIFAVVVAFVFWLAITIDQTEVISKTFANISINITTEGSFAGNMGLQVIAIENEKNATVTAYGPNSTVSALEVSDILITADLSDVTGAGTYAINLNVQPIDRQSGVTFEVSPKTINVTFDHVDTIEFDVTPTAKGITLEEDSDTNLFIGDPVINSADFLKVSIGGARANMKLLNRVEAVVKTTEVIGESKTYDANIVLYDKDGKELDKSLFILPVESVKVTVPVYKERTVAIAPVFINEPTVGAGQEKVRKVSVTKVTVYGLPETVDNLVDIKLTDIDYREISAGKTTFNVKIKLPDGIYLKSDVSNITVTLNAN